MLHIVKKWQIIIEFEDQDNITIYLHDDIPENVLRKLADIDWGYQPSGFDIEEVKKEEQKGATYAQSGGVKYDPTNR